jgi:hypothetical protein
MHTPLDQYSTSKQFTINLALAKRFNIGVAAKTEGQSKEKLLGRKKYLGRATRTAQSAQM